MLLSFLLMAATAAASPRRAKAAQAAARTAAGRPRTVLLPSPGSPLCAIRLFFQTGAADDPKGKEGLAALTAAMLGEGGTRRRTFAQVLDALYPIAARIRVYGDKDGYVFEGMVHRDNLAAFADLLAQQILEPRFSEDDFTRNRQDAIDYLEKTLRGNDDEGLGKQAFATVLYPGGHPYGRPSVGTVAGLRAITLADVKAFYSAAFTRDRLIVGLAGGYPPELAQEIVARFDALPARGKPRRRLPASAARRGAEVLIVEKEARSNAISLGHPLPITRADDDFYPLALAGSYLGEHRTFNGVLMINMRQKRGLNYGDYAYVESFIQEGWSTFPLPNVPRRQQHFEIWIRPVSPANTLFALRQALYETQKLVGEGIPPEGFEATRRFLANYVGLWTQDVSRRLGYAIDALVYGKDVIAELRARLPRMTKADVDRAVRKHLRPGDVAIAIVSDQAARLQADLLAGRPSPIVYDTKATPAEVLAEDKVIERLPLPVAKARVRIVAVDRMFER